MCSAAMCEEEDTRAKYRLVNQRAAELLGQETGVYDCLIFSCAK